MNGIIIEKQKRFVTVTEYCKLTGLSYPTVNHLCKTKQIDYILTEGGLKRIDTQPTGLIDNKMADKLEKTEKC